MKKILLAVYPFLFAIYPIFALALFNVMYMDPGSIVRSLIVALLLTGLVWVVMRLIAGEWGKAGVITVWAVILFFTYGHVYLQLQSAFGGAVRHRNLMMLFSLALFLGMWWITKKIKNLAPIQSAFVTMGLVLTGFSIVQLISYEYSHPRLAPSGDPMNSKANLNRVDAQNLPDIYWILLDGHTRTDILKEHYGYDNSAFIRDLEDMGFYVAKCSQSNYISTRYSVTSLMNANYLDQLPNYVDKLPPLSESLVAETIRPLDYTVIAFENRSNGHFDLHEDMRLSRNQLAFGAIDLFGGLNEFEVVLMQTSMLRLVYDMPQLVPGLDPQILLESEYYEHYQQTLFILDKLPHLPKTQGPKFVFVHILVPHPPYIFSPDGKFFWASDQITGYRSNVQFIDTQITKAVKRILENSNVPPIIVIQGDHGPSGNIVTPHMRLSILNAYYVNEGTKSDLYSAITPVNTFRIIFNHYFGSALPVLEDKSYYSSGSVQFTPEYIVPNPCVEP